jgi:putative ABC transport system permease protein
VVVRALRDQGLSAFAVPVSSIVIFTVFAIFFAVLAAVIPARRAAKSDILSAIATT